MENAINSHTELNSVQVSLLRLFNRPMSDDETVALKRILLKHYSEQLKDELGKAISEKGYIKKDLDGMLNKQS